MSGWTVKFYLSARGDSPVEDFLNKQNAQTVAKTIRLLELLETYGPNLRMPYTRYMGESVYELRIKSRDEVRIFYIYHSKKTIYLLHAFKKSTQKTPQKELKMAEKRKKELTEI